MIFPSFVVLNVSVVWSFYAFTARILWVMTDMQIWLSGLGLQPYIFLQFSILQKLGARYLSSSLNMKAMKAQNIGPTAWFTR